MSGTNNFKVSNPFQIGLLGGLGVLAALLIGGALTTLASVITYVFAAVFIALGLDPIVSSLEKKGIKRPLGILIVIAALALVLTLLVVLVLPELITQSTTFIASVPGIVNDFQSLPWLVSLDKQFNGGITTALNGVSAFIADAGNWPTLLGGVVQVGISIFNGFTGGLIIFILTLYFLASLKSFKKASYAMVAASRREKFQDIAEQVSDSIGRYVIGQLSIAAINATFATILMMILGNRFAVIFGFIAFLLALIPLVGSLTTWAVVTLVTFTWSPTSAIIFLIGYFVYMQVEAYFISPKIMSKAVSVPGVMVVIAALAGGALLGVLGALVAIPVAASVILIIRQVWLPRQEAR